MISRIGTRTLGLLCGRLALAFDVGHEPVRIFEREAGEGRSRHGRHMRSIAEHIRQGCSLTEAMHAQGNYFPPNFHRLIEVGEKSGRLEQVLDRMADHYKEVAGLQDTFRRSILMPLIQLGLAVLVVSILIYIPPLLTPRREDAIDLLGLGLVGGWGLAIFWGLVAAVVGMVAALLLLMRNGKLAMLRSSLTRVPVLGRAILVFDEAMFVQSLALAIESGVVAANAVTLSFRSCSSGVFQSKADAAREAILKGHEMHDVLRDTGLFSRETIEAVELGEASGRLAETLDSHFAVLRIRVSSAMAAITQIVSSAVWITVTGLIAMLIFRLFGRYVSQINRAVMETSFLHGLGAPSRL